MRPIFIGRSVPTKHIESSYSTGKKQKEKNKDKKQILNPKRHTRLADGKPRARQNLPRHHHASQP